jgi:hypothetical protein
MATGSVYFPTVDNKKQRSYTGSSEGAADCCAYFSQKREKKQKNETSKIQKEGNPSKQAYV